MSDLEYNPPLLPFVALGLLLVCLVHLLTQMTPGTRAQSERRPEIVMRISRLGALHNLLRPSQGKLDLATNRMGGVMATLPPC